MLANAMEFVEMIGRHTHTHTHTHTPAPTLLVTRRIKKLLTQTPTSQNRSKAVRHLTQHPGTPYTADLKAFASLHYVHSQACFTPTCPPQPCIKVSGYCNCGLQAVCPHPHAAPTVGHGVRQPFPTVCPIHRSQPPAAILQSHVAMLQQFTHLHCHLASPYHCLEAPRDSSP